MKLWFKIILGIVLVLGIVTMVAGFYFYHLAIDRNHKDFLQGDANLQVSKKSMNIFLQGEWREWVRSQDFTDLQMKSYDGIRLHAYYLKAKKPTNKTVILAHGYLANGKDMGIYAKYYYEQLGYNILMPDARGHGKSGGNYIGFGWPDRLDYVKWIDLMIDQTGPQTEIVLHGVSMGAATVLMTSGEKLPTNVKAIVSDSAYTSVWDLFSYQLKRMYHLPAIPILNATNIVTKMRAGYSLKEASALNQVKKAHVPILYIHGSADQFVPTGMSKKLYNNTKSDAELMIVSGAGHGESYVVDKKDYQRKLLSFLHQYVNKVE